MNPERNDTIRLFVYGTLMSDGCRAAVLAKQRFVSRARTRPIYRLLDLSAYPGLISVDDRGLAIEGELYNVAKALVPQLDQIEGAPSLFRLQEVELEDPVGVAWAYFYQQTTADIPMFPGTRWHNDGTLPKAPES
jgi:gamma-glutamylcyclotransferase (GGCT)/AIG2-like uncharacterized protein YtfP